MAFVLMFGLLVVFHEFGHYIVARWMGVQVLSFSVGFGPVLLRWVRGPTEYAIRALPLGGFVRMLGDDPTAPMEDAAARDPQAFHNKAVWRRMLIIVAGPVFNFILPLLVLFGSSLVYDAQVLPARVGTAIAGGPAALAKLQPGDLIVQIDDQPVGSFDDLVREVGKRADQRSTMTVLRNERQLAVEITPRTVVHAGAAEVGVVERVGRIQMSPFEQVPTIAVAPGSPLWLAGLRNGDRLTQVGDQLVKTWHQMAAALHKTVDATTLKWIPLGVPATVSKDKAPTALATLHTAQPLSASVRATQPPTGAGDEGQLQERWGAIAGNRLVGPLLTGSGEVVQASLRAGDEIVQVDAIAVVGMEQLFDQLKLPYQAVLLHPEYRKWSAADRVQRLRAAMVPRTLTIVRTLRGEELAATAALQAELRSNLRPAQDGWQKWLAAAPPVSPDGLVRWQTTYTPPVHADKDDRPSLAIELISVVDRLAPQRIANPKPLAHALHSTLEQFSRGSLLILATTAELFKGNAPIKEVGGIIRMAQLTSDAADHGVERLLQLLAVLSINLGILNLLPIPLVDGGQLLFLAIEAVRRQPASLRVRQIAAYVGLTFLGLLFLVVMKNDLQSLFSR